MSIQANVTLDRQELVAELSDGRLICQADLQLFANALHRAGVFASHIECAHRSGRRILTAGQQVALNAALHQLERAHFSKNLAA